MLCIAQVDHVPPKPLRKPPKRPPQGKPPARGKRG
jgi:hypothetical protein